MRIEDGVVVPEPYDPAFDEYAFDTAGKARDRVAKCVDTLAAWKGTMTSLEERGAPLDERLCQQLAKDLKVMLRRLHEAHRGLVRLEEMLDERICAGPSLRKPSR